MKYQNFYERSPLLLQNIMTTMYGYSMRRKRYSHAYIAHMEFLKEFECHSLKKQKSYQFREIMRLLYYAVNNSAFYRALYRNIDIASFNNTDDLQRLPIVTKEMIRQNIDDIITVDRKLGVENHTGGTTGKSLVTFFTREDMEKRMANLDYFKLKHGFTSYKMRRASFTGKHIVPPTQQSKVFWRYNAAAKQMVYSSFHHNEDNIPYYVASLNRFHPQAIDGFFSSIFDIASFVERHSLPLSFVPIAIFPTSETIVPAQREVIERVFRCKVRDQYASSEGAPFVYECPEGNIHYDLSSGVIEHLDGTDEILITSFTTYGTPLIRYRIGDSMIFADPELICPCGFASPLVKSIEGRAADYLLATNGTRINLGNISNIVKNLPNSIIKMQIIQREITAIQVCLIVDPARYTQSHNQIVLDEIRHKFGQDMQVELEFADDIPREKSGKYAIIKNLVPAQSDNSSATHAQR